MQQCSVIIHDAQLTSYTGYKSHNTLKKSTVYGEVNHTTELRVGLSDLLDALCWGYLGFPTCLEVAHACFACLYVAVWISAIILGLLSARPQVDLIGEAMGWANMGGSET